MGAAATLPATGDIFFKKNKKIERQDVQNGPSSGAAWLFRAQRPCSIKRLQKARISFSFKGLQRKDQIL
ncbi:hypothetical protein [Roseibium salinum]|uniref:Uncharacterized protein n=1 Tax=Roseibium salinum TaxID=1604349 RepID=A0ABT3QZG9_9HYPH|nr:hypothetical protein [Roseibium sp. DSM 29163]MCX2722297.1 hypothetical protein [Roseibium sp. DSM 29163]